MQALQLDAERGSRILAKREWSACTFDRCGQLETGQLDEWAPDVRLLAQSASFQVCEKRVDSLQDYDRNQNTDNHRRNAGQKAVVSAASASNGVHHRRSAARARFRTAQLVYPLVLNLFPSIQIANFIRVRRAGLCGRFIYRCALLLLNVALAQRESIG